MVVPRETRRKGKKDSPDESVLPQPAAVTDEEWEAFFRRSLALRPHVAEVPVTPAALLPPPALDEPDATPPPTVHLRTLDEVKAFLAPAEAETRGQEADEVLPVPSPAAESPPPLEQERCPSPNGRADAAVQGDSAAPPALEPKCDVPSPALDQLAPPALPSDARGLQWRDYDDIVLLAIVLDWWVRGVSIESRAPAVRAAVQEMPARNSDLIRRLEALLPPR